MWMEESVKDMVRKEDRANVQLPSVQTMFSVREYVGKHVANRGCAMKNVPSQNRSELSPLDNRDKRQRSQMLVGMTPLPVHSFLHMKSRMFLDLEMLFLL